MAVFFSPILLPPANEVWSKVICLHLSVILSIWGGLVPGGVPGGDPPWTATAAGGTHPTGMHSCF